MKEAGEQIKKRLREHPNGYVHGRKVIDIEDAMDLVDDILAADQDTRLKRIAHYYGYTEQASQLVEEMAELTQALNKFRRKRKEYMETKSNPAQGTIEDVTGTLIEELADVSICLEQVVYLLNAKKDVEDIREEKIKRQLERMEHDKDM